MVPSCALVAGPEVTVPDAVLQGALMQVRQTETILGQGEESAAT